MHRLGTLALLPLVAALLLSGCDSSDPQDVVILIPRDVSESQYTTLESGLRYYDFEIGDGEEVTDSSTIRVYYGSWLTNDALIASTQNKGPITVDLSSSSVVEGWVVGIPGMRVGGERQLVVPPELAFGEEGFPEVGIPPNASIVYEIDVVSIEN